MTGILYALCPLFVLGGFVTGVLMERGGRRRNIRTASSLIVELRELERENENLKYTVAIYEDAIKQNPHYDTYVISEVP